ncbi:MAG TPA: zf-TFIIB domain-containing protein [Vicinamibacterales bacterium]|jgi:uncharacterized protein (DUF983 family)|nr:zf-TFIIB domain-containing protein [Vicinamibacterales bacterium]
MAPCPRCGAPLAPAYKGDSLVYHVCAACGASTIRSADDRAHNLSAPLFLIAALIFAGLALWSLFIPE